jgi:predicted nucleic acid-binding protein
MGAVGVLEQAAAQGLVDLSEVLTRLLTTNFRILRTIINDALTRDAERKRREGENQKQG